MVPDTFPLFPNSPPADFTSLAGGAIPKAYLNRSGKGEGLRMFKRLVRHGNSLALVIDRPLLDLLHIDAETFLDIQTDGKRLVVTPVHGDDRRKKFLEALENGNRRYGRALKKLAE